MPLLGALESIEPFWREDVPEGLGSRDDAAVLEVPPGKSLVQSVDFFPAIVDDPYLFGRIAANHALGDIFAMGAVPQSALAVAGVPFGTAAKSEELLRQMLLGANAVFGEARTNLAGGHTSECPEVALGFVINGLADKDGLLRKRGLRESDVLILTKALGTGVLFAAEMRLAAKGRWIEGAVESMLESSRDAARILREHGAHACTDITGFGLAGHLVEMLEASQGLGRDLARLSALPGRSLGMFRQRHLQLPSRGKPQSVEPSRRREHRKRATGVRTAVRPADRRRTARGNPGAERNGVLGRAAPSWLRAGGENRPRATPAIRRVSIDRALARRGRADRGGSVAEEALLKDRMDASAGLTPN